METRALQTQDKYVVRLPDGMRDRIKAAAAKNNRSMNAEIVAALEEKFPAPMPGLEEFSEQLHQALGSETLEKIDSVLNGLNEIIERMRSIREAKR